MGPAEPTIRKGAPAAQEDTVARTTTSSSKARRARQPGLVVDEDGFLVDPDTWTRTAAQLLADVDGVGALGNEHWAIIEYLRGHYLAHGTLPVMRHVCRVNHLERDAVRRLFGGCREAWRVSGLPNPGEEAKAYMD
jgi:tRNA 2-thiouridine synthesizing protein E